MDREYFYKVVCVHEAQMTSWCHVLAGHHIYGPGVETHRKEGWGPLTVFSTLGHAAAFLLENGAQAGSSFRQDPTYAELILKCEIDRSDQRRLWGLSYTKDDYFPGGTVFANRVRGIEIVDPEILAVTFMAFGAKDSPTLVAYRDDWRKWMWSRSTGLTVNDIMGFQPCIDRANIEYWFGDRVAVPLAEILRDERIFPEWRVWMGAMLYGEPLLAWSIGELLDRGAPLIPALIQQQPLIAALIRVRRYAPNFVMDQLAELQRVFPLAEGDEA